jgi:hypothetical protein
VWPVHKSPKYYVLLHQPWKLINKTVFSNELLFLWCLFLFCVWVFTCACVILLEYIIFYWLCWFLLCLCSSIVLLLNYLACKRNVFSCVLKKQTHLNIFICWKYFLFCISNPEIIF